MDTSHDDNRESTAGSDPSPDLVKVVDRQGRVKMISRAEYEAKKRRRRKRDAARSAPPLKDILSVILVLVLIAIASYIALTIVK
ncbi:MAG: hypothetical protein C4524_04185 [Candidatus Zixiibacteriota bacterium]|nr:MAG: hypothetical protein C4524_04185 [candidate division Zixibacteria bacterium]